jgi:DNA-binding transcriptional LysR family regulator
MIVLMSHVRTLRWASIMPAVLAEALGPLPGLRAIPIVEPDIRHMVGIVVPEREPATPMVAALVGLCRQVARTMSEGAPSAQELQSCSAQ